jgi:hypothetical protein
LSLVTVVLFCERSLGLQLRSRFARIRNHAEHSKLSFAAGIQRTWNSAPYLRSSAPCKHWFYNARKRIPAFLYSVRSFCEAASSNARVAPIRVLSRLLDMPTAAVVSVEAVEWKRGSVRFAELTQRAWTRSSLLKRRAARTTRGGLRNLPACTSHCPMPVAHRLDFHPCLTVQRNPLNRPMRTRMSGGCAGKNRHGVVNERVTQGRRSEPPCPRVMRGQSLASLPRL